jgi:glutathione synthase/RimK-type ligase-like ATP-grasp enzyme
MRHVWAQQAPFPGIEETSTYRGSVDVRVGIIKSFNYWHQYYAAACRELQVPYCMIDIERVDWMTQVRSSDCSAFLVWPTPYLSVWKQMYDERLAVIARLPGAMVYPELDAMLIYESKRRMHYWLAATGFPHPETWIFYNRDEAMAFAEASELPIVTKTDLGAVSSGVRILRRRDEVRRAVLKAFGRGVLRRGGDRRDREWGSVLFQRFVPDASEWRIIRIGESYFGYEKIRVGDFHSGTEQWRYVRPPDELLAITRQLTDRGRFTSMSVDVLVDRSGKSYVNELQGVFGMLNDYACMVDGKMGRMLHEDSTKAWHFEEGDFCRNRMCNLRVQAVLRLLEVPMDAERRARRAGPASGTPSPA